MTDCLADAYAHALRLTAAIATEEYDQALWEDYHDGRLYDERPSLERFRPEWEEATAERGSTGSSRVRVLAVVAYRHGLW
jgi:hypothetical protein